MDSGDMAAAMGGFLMGQMFTRQTQGKTEALHFVSVRVDRDAKILDTLAEVILELFLEEGFSKEDLLLQWDKGKFKVLRKKKSIGEKPLIVFELMTYAYNRKDYFITFGLRTQMGEPILFNIALFRHLILKLDAKKVKYEIW